VVLLKQMQKELFDVWKRRAKAEMDSILREGRERKSLEFHS